MILLTSTSDLLELTTGSNQTIHVHADYADNNSGTITPGRLNTIISSATTTTIVGSPSSSVQRAIKHVFIYNDGSASETVTVKHTDGTNVITLVSVTLLLGEALEYTEAEGWLHLTANGAVYQTTGIGAVNQTTKASMVPTSTSSYVMGGMNLTLTPNRSGNVVVDFSGYLTASVTTVAEGIKVQIAYGTGGAPSYQGSATGTTVGEIMQYENAIALTTAADLNAPISMQSLITGLTLGTSYWFDVQIEGITAEDVTINNCVLTVVEC